VNRRQPATLVLGLVALGAGVAVLLYALILGFHIEGTPQALADSAKGQRIAVPAVVAVLCGAVAVGGRSRGWALPVGGVGALAAALAVLLSVLLPGG
jgi:hypothetical protein